MQQRQFLAASFAAIAMVCGLVLSANAQIVDIVNDSFTDGDRAITGMSGSDMEANFFNTSSNDGIESNVGSVGLVSGTSGRQIHALFPAQTLVSAGDIVSAQISFTTGIVTANATQAEVDALDPTGAISLSGVPTGGDDLRVGLFDTSTSPTPGALAGDITNSSGTPNPALLIDGYAVEFDVEAAGVTSTDHQIRETNRADAAFDGNLLASSGGFTNLTPTPGSGSNSGPDVGYTFLSNSDYIVGFEALLNADGSISLTSTLTDAAGVVSSHTVTDDTPSTLTFDFFGVGASSEAFGLSNDPDTPENGLDITNFTVQSNITAAAVPEPSSLALLGLMGCAGLIRRRR